ncbi:MAG: hypothetical protein L6R41_001405 [Letrouitia leprolyta]|nr:MAG: hypothetical protein L6R41_001405 [Letrouitia leprolyta]
MKKNLAAMDVEKPIMTQSKTVAIQSPSATPTSPSKRPIMITQGQKQALIDNLQLEVTERARKLRAQYALQAQSLRTRIELRVNRIPTAMRKAKMGDLYEKYIENTKQSTKPVTNQSTLSTGMNPQHQSPVKATPVSPSKKETVPPQRGTKRPSDHFSADDDKENTPDPAHPLSTKKRPKHNAHPSNPATVLSPKSSNLRNHSPVRPRLGSPQKSYLSHPISPLKPSGGLSTARPESPAKAAAIVATAAVSSTSTTAEKPRATRTRAAAASKPAKAAVTAATKTRAAPNTRAKRGIEGPVELPKHELRTVSVASNTSTGTTVVRRNGKGTANGGAAGAKAKGKEAGAKGGKSAGKKGATVAAPAATAEGQTQGRRVLRKR